MNLQKALTGAPTTLVTLSTSNNSLSDLDKTALLGTFHKAGRDLYRRLFLSDSHLKVLAKILDGYEPVNRHLRIRLQTTRVYVPWQMLHPLGPVDEKQFWGFRYELIVDPQDERPPGYYPGSLQHFNGPVIFSRYKADANDIAEDKTVADLGEHQVQFMTSKLGLKNLIPVDSRSAFGDAVKDNLDTVQMIVAYTHAENGTRFRALKGGDYVVEQLASGPRLFFTKTEFLPALDLDEVPADLNLEEISFRQHPLVLLNGCETGGGGYFATETLSFPNIFLHFGARGVIATEAPVWPMFGCFFAQALLTNLMGDKPASLSVLYARLDFLKTFSNPLGLLYSYYGGVDAALSLQ